MRKFLVAAFAALCIAGCGVSDIDSEVQASIRQGVDINIEAIESASSKTLIPITLYKSSLELGRSSLIQPPFVTPQFTKAVDTCTTVMYGLATLEHEAMRGLTQQNAMSDAGQPYSGLRYAVARDYMGQACNALSAAESSVIVGDRSVKEKADLHAIYRYYDSASKYFALAIHALTAASDVLSEEVVK